MPIATALLNDGVPLKMVSDQLGHSSIAITADVYGVTEDDRQREVSERVGRLFGIGENEVFAAFASYSHTEWRTRRVFDRR
jgi:hypothetical protein